MQTKWRADLRLHRPGAGARKEATRRTRVEGHVAKDGHSTSTRIPSEVLAPAMAAEARAEELAEAARDKFREKEERFKDGAGPIKAEVGQKKFEDVCKYVSAGCHLALFS